jgi:hypothetical protein
VCPGQMILLRHGRVDRSEEDHPVVGHYVGAQPLDRLGAEGARLTDARRPRPRLVDLVADGQGARQQAEADGHPVGMQAVRDARKLK